MLTAGAWYDLGIARLHAGCQRGRDLNANFVGAATNPAAVSGSIGSYQDTKSYTVGVRKDIGLVSLGVNYSKTDFENAASGSVSLGRVAFGGTYGLSKRTRLYSAYGQATGDAKERIVESRLFQVGINHTF
jgi:predicted porin